MKYKLVGKRSICGRERCVYKANRKLYVKTKTGDYIELKEYENRKTKNP